MFTVSACTRFDDLDLPRIRLVADHEGFLQSSFIALCLV